MTRLIIILIGSILYLSTVAQEAMKPAFEIYGQVMTDIGYNFGQVNPLYFDVMRPTQLPAFKNLVLVRMPVKPHFICFMPGSR
jgi:hypothetical protein